MRVIDVALSQYGIKEIPGTRHNPEVLKYFRETGYNEKHITDETAWCSAALIWIAQTCDISVHPKVNLTARSWQNAGKKIEVPNIGDLAIFWRTAPSSWKGHVGIYISENKNYIYVLGGNQRNSFCIMPYPKSRLLGFRRIQEPQKPERVEVVVEVEKIREKEIVKEIEKPLTDYPAGKLFSAWWAKIFTLKSPKTSA